MFRQGNENDHHDDPIQGPNGVGEPWILAAKVVFEIFYLLAGGKGEGKCRNALQEGEGSRRAIHQHHGDRKNQAQER